MDKLCAGLGHQDSSMILLNVDPGFDEIRDNRGASYHLENLLLYGAVTPSSHLLLFQSP